MNKKTEIINIIFTQNTASALGQLGKIEIQKISMQLDVKPMKKAPICTWSLGYKSEAPAE